jgi:fatty acid desaturase 2 (delta-6 desaturase)
MPPQGETISEPELKHFTWEEVQKHNTAESTYLAIGGSVYDVTRFKDKHPGGKNVMLDCAGQDCTITFQNYHWDMVKCKKYMAPLKVGVVENNPEQRINYDKVYEDLTQTVKDMGLFVADRQFHALFSYHVFTLAVFGVVIIKLLGTGWIPFILSFSCMGLCMLLCMIECHDWGHRSITGTKFDKFVQRFFFNTINGQSGCVWDDFHTRHHIHPNKIGKDPVVVPPGHVISTQTALEQAAADVKKGRPSMPFQFQHYYFNIIGLPLWLPIFFQMASFKFTWGRRFYLDLVMMCLCFTWYGLAYIPSLGVGWTLVHWWMARQIQSQLFIWITLANHLPLDQLYDKVEGESWLEYAAFTTINLGDSYLADYYTGGQNWQIEHHLWPSMPRENLRRAAPVVKAAFKKYNLPYYEIETIKAYSSVFNALKKFGMTWQEAYYSAMTGK